ncbi:unnamed protein product [Rotaria sp. Silwood2]|nr:unnamed protein product [Rotaria sp. Silwood2]
MQRCIINTQQHCCPCSQISVPYGAFFNITYTLHQICSSDLVSPAWLEFILAYNQTFAVYDSAGYFQRDFRSIGASYFQLLATFCSIAKENIDEALLTLAKAQFVNDRVISKSSFIQQMQNLNNTYTNSIRKEFLITKEWLYTTAQTNQFLNALEINTKILVNNDDFSIIIADLSLAEFSYPNDNSISVNGACSCRRNGYLCSIASILYYNTVNGSQTWHYFIGMDVGCVPLFGLLKSSIDWWYKSIYIEQIRESFAEGIQSKLSPDIHSLDSNISSRFRNDDGTYPEFNVLVDEMLIESWTSDVSRFDLFYSQCQPKSCSYVIDARYPRFVALLILISICGGLNRGFRLPIPMINRVKHFLARVYQSLITMNLFKSTRTNNISQHTERIYKRFYVILMTASIVILLLCTSLNQRSKTETIKAPMNPFEFEQLYRFYSDNLNCPCTQLSISYSNFFSKIEVESFHPVCSSDFVSSNWLIYLGTQYGPPDWTSNQDFRQWGAAYFRTLQTLCSVAKATVTGILENFLSSISVINRIISQDEFNRQMNVTLDHLKGSMPETFIQALTLIRITGQSNGLMNVFSSN